MKIFLSYASQDIQLAKAIYLALRDQGHSVFFDRAELPAGDEYHNRIRAAVEKSRLFLFLISAKAIDAGSYTLTELDIAEKAGKKILPVLLEKTPIEALPASVKAITLLQPEGNPPAAVAAEVHRIASTLRRRRIKQSLGALFLTAIVTSAVLLAMRMRSRTESVGNNGAPAALIPSGTFMMGDDEESPRREIFLDEFYLDRYEVTVARYAVFMKETGNVKPPEEWETIELKNDGDLPVIGVSWQAASSYCRWAGGRLPTEAEWERAARGNDERRYPWGNDPPTAESARYGKRYQNPVYQGGVARVGSYGNDRSPFGILDLAGNVTEWVADWFSESFPEDDVRNPTGPDSGTSKVLRGASWYEPADRLGVTRRWHANPSTRNNGIGFRCARDVK
ncbi:MAG TPA: SUMF1/EgtB/PvdO family nonheme iron enzyme [Candidatus Binatia bacterium]